MPSMCITFSEVYWNNHAKFEYVDSKEYVISNADKIEKIHEEATTNILDMWHQGSCMQVANTYYFSLAIGIAYHQ